MLVELRPGVANVTINDGNKFFSLNQGDQIQLYGDLLMRLMKQNLVVKSEYKEFLNDEIITVEYVNEIGFRPVGKRKLK